MESKKTKPSRAGLIKTDTLQNKLREYAKDSELVAIHGQDMFEQAATDLDSAYEEIARLKKERDELRKVVAGCASCCREMKCKAAKRRDYEQAYCWREAERAEIRKGER